MASISQWPWIIVALTLVLVLRLQKSELQPIKKVLQWFPAILFAYLIPALMSLLGKVDYSSHSIHDISRDFVIPLAIVSAMASLSLQQLLKMGWRPLVVFVGGSLFIGLFPVISVLAMQESNFVVETLKAEKLWRGLPPIVGSWIGGSTSQLVLKEVVECPESVFLSILILDNILVNIWTILMFQVIKQTDRINSLLHLPAQRDQDLVEQGSGTQLHPLLACLLLVGSVLLVNAFTQNLLIKIFILSAVGMGLSNLVRGWPTNTILRASSLLILLVMAILGLKLQFESLHLDGNFVLFLVIWLIGHFVFMMLLAKVLKVDALWVPIASMANVGGIATAPAVTSAYDSRFMPHAIVLAVLSMATGTLWGLLTIMGLQFILAVP